MRNFVRNKRLAILNNIKFISVINFFQLNLFKKLKSTTLSSVVNPISYLINAFLDLSVVSKGDLLNSANYTDNGGVATFNASTITLNGGIGDFSKWLEYNNWYTDRENLKWSDTITVNTITPTTYGYGMQIHSEYNQFSTWALGLDSGGANGTLYEFDFAGAILQSVALAIPAVVAGNVIRFDLERINSTLIKFTVTNITQSTTASIQRQYNFNSPFTYILPVVSKFKRVLFGLNGTLTASTITATVEYTYPNAIFCFDSKGAGYFSTGTTTANRFVDVIKIAYPTYNIYCNSGANEDITDLSLKLTELLSYKSSHARRTKIFIGVGCNDIRNGTFDVTRKNLLISTFNSLKAANFDPYICYAIPENGLDITPFNTWAASEPTFTGKVITGTYTAMWSGVGTTPNAAYISADGIHPNLVGQTILANVFSGTYIY